MANTNLLTVRGLHTFNNDLSAVPEGALKVAKNINIDRNGVAEPRRGFKVWRTFVNSTHRAKSLIPYKSNLIVHYDNKLAYDNGTTLVDYPGTISEVVANYRINHVIQNGNLYITTSDGIKKVATSDVLANATITNAGGLRSLAGEAIPDYSTLGFLPPLSKVGYRITWGTLDVNGNLIEGPPSPIFECLNPSTTASCNVNITFSPPPGANNTHFYRIYRTDIFTGSTILELSTLQVSDELKLVYEAPYDGIATSITVNDIASAIFRNNQIILYTNQISGEGISQANYAPPFSHDIESFKGYAFYANTKLKHFKLIEILGVNSFPSYGGANVYDVNENLALIPLNPDNSISSITLNTSTVDVTFTGSSAPVYLPVGARFIIEGTGISGLDGNEFVVSAVSGTTITFNGSFSGTPTPATTVIYPSYFSIKKNTLPETRYFTRGLKEIEEFQFAGFTSASDRSDKFPKDKLIVIYSANNRFKYGIWFSHNTTDVAPYFDGVLIKVELHSTSMTAAQVAEKFKDAIENDTLDLEAVVFGTDSDKVRVVRIISGVCDPTVIDPNFTDTPPGIVSYTLVQNGVGEDIANKRILLPRALSPAVSIDEFSKSLCRVVNANTAEHVNAFYIFNPNSNPGNIEFQSKTWEDEAIEFDFKPIEFRVNFKPELPTQTENLKKLNRLYYSKLRQPEAVPLVNYFDVGSSDFEIQRIVALQESLFIFKKDGIFRLSGQTENSFSISLLDKSTYLVATDAVTVLNNLIYVFTSQGVVQVSESGVSIISRPIENLLYKYYSSDFANILHTLFMFASEEDRALFFAVPQNSTDTYATSIYRFNVFTQAWTEWTLTAVSGVVLGNRIYIGAGDLNVIDRERKNFSKYDYADRILPKQFLTSGFISPDRFKLGNVDQIEIGDVLYQKQAVTISKFNALTAQLYNDPAIQALPPAQKNFYNTFKAQIGDNIAQKLTILATTLNTDLSTSFTTTFTNNPNVLYGQYNTFISQLNSAPELILASYPPLTSYTYYESPVLKIDALNKIVTVIKKTPFIEGDVELHKAIKAEIEYAPITFGDVSQLKHVRYGSLLLANADLYEAKFGFASDLSPSFDYSTFHLEGDGSWGVFFYNSTAWGGVGTQIPFRCTIPRQKQRCRFLRPKFKHYVAFFKFLVLGLSLEFDIAGSNAYRYR